MNLKIRKILPALTVTLIAFTSICRAEEQTDLMDWNEGSEGMMMGANETNAPSARPYWMDTEGKMHVDTGFLFDVSLLVWQAHSDDLDAGVLNTSFVSVTPDFKASRFANAEYKHMNFDWNVGVRAGIGYYFDHDNWDVYGVWTHFHDRAHRNINVAEEIANPMLFPVWSSALVLIDPVIAQHGANGNLRSQLLKAHWRLKLDLIDVELGRQFFAGRQLVFRPNIGLRGGWIKQHFSIEYDEVFSSAFLDSFDIEGPNIIEDSFMRNDFKGIGPIVGLDTEWHFGQTDVSLFANAAISLLYGRYHLSALEGDTILSEIQTGDIVLNTSERFNDSKAITDLTIGLSWQQDLSCWCKETRLTISAAWEHHLFFNQLQLKRLSTLNFDLPSVQQVGGLSPNWTEYVRETADLSTQGVTISAFFEF